MSEKPRIRVLLIDDDPAAFLLTRAMMDQIASSDFELEHVATAAEGGELMAQREHDVYLVDYLIGDDSGIDLVRAARAGGNRAPMILLTGKGRYEVDVEAMGAGVSDYLEKGKVGPDVMERSIRYSLERERTEAQLRDSEERHRSMFDHLPIGLYRTSADGELRDANPALVQLLGHPDRNTMESEYAHNFFVSPAHRQAFLDRLEQFGTVRGFETELRRPDDKLVRVRTAARSHHGTDGLSAYVEGAVEDVSEEVEARDLHGRAARFDWVFEGSGLAIVILDLRGIIEDANPAFLREFGYAVDDIRGRAMAELADEADRDALASEVGRLAAGTHETSEMERRLLAVDGALLWAKTRMGLVRNAKGHPDHLLILLEDVAEG